MSKPVSTITHMHVCPMVNPGPVPHVGGPIIGPGGVTVLVAGLPVALVGDSCVCTGPPDTIAMGSGTVMACGKPVARLGDSTAHGGSIVVGIPTILVGG